MYACTEYMCDLITCLYPYVSVYVCIYIHILINRIMSIYIYTYEIYDIYSNCTDIHDHLIASYLRFSAGGLWISSQLLEVVHIAQPQFGDLPLGGWLLHLGASQI